MGDRGSATENLMAQLRQALTDELTDEPNSDRLCNPLDNPICAVSCDESIPCIAVKWKRYASSAQLRFILEHVIRMLEQHHVGSILADDTALPIIHPSDQDWIIRDWFPRAIAAGWRVSATSVPAEYFGQLATSHVQSKAPASVVIRSFDEIDDARRWLQSYVPQTSPKVNSRQMDSSKN
jgi:hypothetical protein